MASIAVGHGPLDAATVEVTPDGRTITFDGTFGKGAVDLSTVSRQMVSE